ncbi:MAG: recombinase RecT [Thermoplasmata archaeon]|nr:recombinase RecT [Thermoplasmata archaeon]
MKNLQKELFAARDTYTGRFEKSEQATIERYFNIEISWLNSLLHSDTKLRSCTDASKCKVLANVVSTGLTLSPAMKYCYVIPRMDNASGEMRATLDISYMGLIKMLTDAGTVAKVEAHIIYANDQYEIEYGLTPKFKHVPTLTNRGEMVAVYSIAHLRGTDPQVEILTADDVAEIRAVAGARGQIWEKWPAQMWRKSAIKRLFKYLPKTEISDNLIAALAIEYRNDTTMITENDVDANVLSEIFADNAPAVLEGEKPAETPSDTTPQKTTKKAAIKPKTEPKEAKESTVKETKVVQLNPSDQISAPIIKSTEIKGGGLSNLLTQLK